MSGCALASPGDGAVTSEQADTINPVDNEELGTVLVHRPPAGGVLGFSVKVDGRPIELEVPLRIKEGTHVMSLEQDGGDWGEAKRPAAQHRRIEVAKSATTAVNLSAMTIAFPLPDRSEGELNAIDEPFLTLTVDNTPRPRDCARNADPVCDLPERQILVATGGLVGIWSGSSAAAVALFPGSYSVESPAGTVGIVLSPSAYQLVSGGAVAVTRGALSILAPVRELPNARNDQLVIRIGGSGRTETTVDPRVSTTIHAVGFHPNRNAYATLGPRRILQTFRDGATATLALGRVDVGDIVITRENGTTYTTRGTYTVTCTTDETELGSFSTPSGIDVLPGAYRIALTYLTQEGPRSQVFQRSF